MVHKVSSVAVSEGEAADANDDDDEEGEEASVEMKGDKKGR